MNLMLWVGIPLVLAGTPSMFIFERGSFLRWAMSKVTLVGWALVCGAIGGYLILRLFSNLPGA